MRRSFKQFLIESPLPDDWNHAIFDENISFNKRVAYAKQHAAQIGSGSARVCFIIPYQGRDTVLKIAKNKKGMAQNEHEAGCFGDYYLKNMGIVIPMIDYDEDNEQPTWIHVEKASKAKDSDFVKVCGGKLSDLIAHALKVTGKPGYSNGNPDKISDENEFAYDFANLIGNYDLPIGDFGRLANWGIYDGNPVIIDLGLNDDIYKEHYTKKPKTNNWY